MAKFEINVPVETGEAAVVVDVDAQAPMPLGRHSFQLIVTDDSGNESEPTQFVVIVADRTRPVAVLDGPEIVDIGKSFQLVGKRSFDIGGSIKSYRYTYLGPTR